jgi:hypothetical protein
MTTVIVFTAITLPIIYIAFYSYIACTSKVPQWGEGLLSKVKVKSPNLRAAWSQSEHVPNSANGSVAVRPISSPYVDSAKC